MSPAVAHQLDSDPRLNRHPAWPMPSLEFTAMATQAAPPLHLADSEPRKVGDSIALAVRDLDTGQRVFCAPGLARISQTERDWMRDADCLLLDPQASPAVDADDPPWLAQLRELPARHNVLFGVLPAAARRASGAGHGIALAYDGMEIEI